MHALKALAAGALLLLAGVGPAAAETVPTFALAWFDPGGRLRVSASPDGRRWSPPVRHGPAFRSQNGPAFGFAGGRFWRLFWFTPDRTRIGTSRGVGDARRGIRFGPPRFHAVPAAHRPDDDPNVRPAAAYDGKRWVLAYRNRRPGGITIVRTGLASGAPWSIRTLSGAGWIAPPALAHGNGAFLLATVALAPRAGAPTRYRLRMRRSADGRRWSPPFEPRRTASRHGGGQGSEHGQRSSPPFVVPVQGPVLAFAGGRFLLAASVRRERAAPRFLYRYDVFGSTKGAVWLRLSGHFTLWSTTRAAAGLAVTPKGCRLLAVSSSRPSGGMAARNIHLRRGAATDARCGKALGINWVHPQAVFEVRSRLDRPVAAAFGLVRLP